MLRPWLAPRVVGAPRRWLSEMPAAAAARAKPVALMESQQEVMTRRAAQRVMRLMASFVRGRGARSAGLGVGGVGGV